VIVVMVMIMISRVRVAIVVWVFFMFRYVCLRVNMVTDGIGGWNSETLKCGSVVLCFYITKIGC
jgi:hypothetical protein